MSLPTAGSIRLVRMNTDPSTPVPGAAWRYGATIRRELAIARAQSYCAAEGIRAGHILHDVDTGGRMRRALAIEVRS